MKLLDYVGFILNYLSKRRVWGGERGVIQVYLISASNSVVARGLVCRNNLYLKLTPVIEPRTSGLRLKATAPYYWDPYYLVLFDYGTHFLNSCLGTF